MRPSIRYIDDGDIEHSNEMPRSAWPAISHGATTRRRNPCSGLNLYVKPGALLEEQHRKYRYRQLGGQGIAVRVEASRATCEAFEDTPRRREHAYYLPAELPNLKISSGLTARSRQRRREECG